MATTKEGKPSKMYYGWWVYVAVCICMLLPCCFTFNPASVYYDSVAEAFGVGKGQVGLYMTFVYATACVANLLWAGKLLEKLDLNAVRFQFCVGLVEVFAPAKQCVYSGKEYGQLERFGYIIIAANIKPHDNIDFFVGGG